MGYVVVGVCYKLPNKEEADETFFRQMEVSCSYVLVLIGNLNHTDICWRDMTGTKQIM